MRGLFAKPDIVYGKVKVLLESLRTSVDNNAVRQQCKPALVVDLWAGAAGPGFCYLAGTDFAGDSLSTLRVGLREKRRAAAHRFMTVWMRY